MEEYRKCRGCNKLLGMHMFHQKNRAEERARGTTSRHWYCIPCRNEERRSLRSLQKSIRLSRQARENERWVFTSPPLAEDYVLGESLYDMVRRLGRDISKVKFDDDGNIV